MCKDSREASTMHSEQEENVEYRLGEQKKIKCNLHSERQRKVHSYKSSSRHIVIVARSIIGIIIFVTMQQYHAVSASPNKDVQPAVRINKCCEKFEIYVDSRCTIAKEVNACKFYQKSNLLFRREEIFFLVL